MARYAEFDDVLARAGRFAPALTIPGKRPNETDVLDILDDLGAELDAAIEALGAEPANLDQRAKDALRDISAYGALARVLPAANPGPQAQPTIDHAEKQWEAGLAGVREGTLPAFRNIAAGMAGTAQSGAGSFWTDDSEAQEVDWTPAFVRSQRT